MYPFVIVLSVYGIAWDGDALFSPITFAGFDSLVINGVLRFNSLDELREAFEHHPAYLAAIEAMLQDQAEIAAASWRAERSELRAQFGRN